METSQSLAVDSFSYSWLSNRKLSMDSSDKMVMDSTFDFPISKSPSRLVHADEIFSHGHILPKYGDQSNPVLSIIPISSSPLNASPNDRIRFPLLKRWRKSSKRILLRYLGFLRPLCRKVGCSRRSARVDVVDGKVWCVKSWNCSPQVSPQQGKANSVGNSWEIKRKGTQTDDTDWEVRKVKSWNNSPQESPLRRPNNYFTDDWSIDSSIYEAILHCKRSCEK